MKTFTAIGCLAIAVACDGAGPGLPGPLAQVTESEQSTLFAEYRTMLGDHDTSADGRRLCRLGLQKRLAEQAGTFVESVTQVSDLQFARSDIRATAAALLAIEITRDEIVGDGGIRTAICAGRARADIETARRELRAFGAVRQDDTKASRATKGSDAKAMPDAMATRRDAVLADRVRRAGARYDEDIARAAWLRELPLVLDHGMTADEVKKIVKPANVPVVVRHYLGIARDRDTGRELLLPSLTLYDEAALAVFGVDNGLACVLELAVRLDERERDPYLATRYRATQQKAELAVAEIVKKVKPPGQWFTLRPTSYRISCEDMIAAGLRSVVAPRVGHDIADRLR